MPTYNDSYIERLGHTDPIVSLVTVTIPAGQSESEPFDTRGMAVVGISMPSQWTAAAIGWKRSHDGAAWSQLVKNSAGQIITCAAGAGDEIAFPQDYMVIGKWLRVCSVNANTGAAVNQAAAREIRLILRRMFS